MSYLGTTQDLHASPDMTSAAYIGDGSTLVYTLPSEVGNDASAMISIDGVRQHTSTYSTSSTTLTFTAPPPNGSAIEVIILGIENVVQSVSDNVVGISQLDLNDGTNGQALMTNGAGVLSFGDVDALPTQAGQLGKYLTTNGTIPAWAALDTDANSTTKLMYEHSHTLTANYSISTGNNALTAGPITINAGVSVTVPTGSTWVIA
jgi:hypothetical protein